MDKVKKNGKWEFDQEVADVFTDMLSRSIPQYSVMRNLTDRVVLQAVKSIKSPIIADIGCSNGLAVEELVNKLPNAFFELSDISEPMLEKCREKYEGKTNVSIKKHDLRKGLYSWGADVVISCLTLQFTPIEYRLQILQSIYESLREDGVFILVEKVIGATANIDNLLVDAYYDIKRENSYSEELIKSKRKSLEGVLVPLTSRFNEELMRTIGFKEIDTYWRCLNFQGWIAKK